MKSKKKDKTGEKNQQKSSSEIHFYEGNEEVEEGCQQNGKEVNIATQLVG